MSLYTWSLDRKTLGLGWLPFHSTMVHWRFSDAVYVVLVILLDGLIFERIEPYQRQFTVNDLTISHPFAPVERVSGKMLLWIVTVSPPLIIAFCVLLLTPKQHKFYVLYVSILGQFVALGTCVFVTDVFKNWIGRCRPDFLDRCQPDPTAIKDTLYYAKEICTTKYKQRLLDGFRTTPSGHSSMSFAALGYTSLWLLGQLQATRTEVGAWRSVVAMLPALYAFYVAMSRTQDYRHHFVDVLLGSVLGSLLAWWSYRRVFPAVTSPKSHLPHALTDSEHTYSRLGNETYPLTSHPDDANSEIRSAV
ncbi:hypothetical protein KL949_002834 [Ogataea haglerorum]|uniref:Phosphatidic acid phosphatase type 2/haloperoxidase domain-containing protein n=1 Tax=Ogataea haglerorum TaxID=1937702 RepID=A0ABQ7REV0_9ASCO|nr:hypothetical protein KL914_003430 [Ogataea haglerorum]KAG7707391.1 hypothetical protein KL950_003051 [Ogataea haglerorum]KAG7718313.1 hypothetical protein KL913_002308 [Ogataea haglerorum]KAG7718838.1 hypothetical protein KL949_002834 [Ogataea haglerorum]KAG7743409.1 hypothetical protein KL932_002150 [Ogataea haglerorum]